MSARSVTWRGFSVSIEVPESVTLLLRRARHIVTRRAPGQLLFADPTPELSIDQRDIGRALSYFANWSGRAASTPAAARDRSLASADLLPDLAGEVAALSWYHTIDLPGGLTTPGLFDHRALVPHYGIPEDLTGQRALDVATFDGFWAFELERRGADVLAVDIPRLSWLDLPPKLKEEILARDLDEESGLGFFLARRALKSSVERSTCSVYELDPERIGTFDLVHVADLLLHLQSPVTALQRIRSVTRGRAIIADVFDPRLLPPAGQTLKYHGGWWSAIWWMPSLNALAQMVLDAGFSRISLHKVYNLPGPRETEGLWRAILIADA